MTELDVRQSSYLHVGSVDTLTSVDPGEGSTAMAPKALGGGTSAVAASTHSACRRFQGTDPLITGMTRRGLAQSVGFSDDFGGIPDARWMRAMTFERLVRDKQFASRVVTSAVGRLGLARPTSVVTVNARLNEQRTAEALRKAHTRALESGAATMIHGLSVPFVGFEGTSATDVKPDFAVVAAKLETEEESWLIIGDAKDYERVRSRIDDTRLMKGFLQVALGAESAASWSRLPSGMEVNDYGILAVPRNAFLQPEAVIELLDDHREEVGLRVAERRQEADQSHWTDGQSVTENVRHLRARFDPSTCGSCTLFSFCRNELRTSTRDEDVLIEIGIPEVERSQAIHLLSDPGYDGPVSASTRAQVQATTTGEMQSTGQLRTDPVGQPGTVNIVIAKSDSAALGVYGVSTQRITSNGTSEWETTIFDDPQDAQTRRKLMRLLGVELRAVLKDRRQANPDDPEPVHVVVPDKPTADVIVSIADNLAGIELSRLRWEEDLRAGRPALTFNGEPADVPDALAGDERLAVSFLLEEDRARSFIVRSPIVDLRETMARHFVPGGPAISAMRLDYLVAWASSSNIKGDRHREISDQIEAEIHTPGARLTNRRSNEIHAALTGDTKDSSRPARPFEYHELIQNELDYKCATVDSGLAALNSIGASNLREVHRRIEGDAQALWRRRLSLHASDLVRFGRTPRPWRNSLVPAIESDDKCHQQLVALTNPQAASDAASDAGTRHLALATVTSTSPLQVAVDSRRIGDGDRIVLLHVNDSTCIESDHVQVKTQKTSFKFSGLSIGPLKAASTDDRVFTWQPHTHPNVAVGDQLVVADFTWFSKLKGDRELPLDRPKPDSNFAPRPSCDESTYGDDPEGHKFCCRPHEVAEAEWSNELAERRARGELNPEVWPPVVDEDGFEVAPSGAAVGDPSSGPAQPAPDSVTLDDLD